MRHSCKVCDPLSQADAPPMVFITDDEGVPVDEGWQGCPFDVPESDEFLFEQLIYRYEVTDGSDPDYVTAFKIIEEVEGFIRKNEAEKKWRKKQRE